MIRLVQCLGAKDLVDHALLQMVLQILPDAWPSQGHGDSQGLQKLRRGNAGPLQNFTRADGAPTENDLTPRPGLIDFSVTDKLNARRARALEGQFVDMDLGF